MSSESGHWYYPDGTPAYTVRGKNGAERPTTLRDAKKLGLVPSVTTIIRCAAAPGLENWKTDQAILAALTCPRIDGEAEADYLSRIKTDAKEQARKAAERGTQIHAWVQAGFEGKQIPEEGVPFILAAVDQLSLVCDHDRLEAEASFATDRYGGKVDLHGDTHLIDIKTTDKDLSTVRTWDEHAMQLAAYDAGIDPGGRDCGILYIHQATAAARLIMVPRDELARGLKCFNALLGYWYAKNWREAE